MIDARMVRISKIRHGPRSTGPHRFLWTKEFVRTLEKWSLFAPSKVDKARGAAKTVITWSRRGKCVKAER